jgi:hypothetical protein
MAPASGNIQFDARRAMELYVGRDYDGLSDYFLGVLASLKQQRWAVATPEILRFVNHFITHFGSLFTQQDYLLSDRHSEKFIFANPLIANLVAMTSFRTTDAWLEILRLQRANLAKILTLLNAR